MREEFNFTVVTSAAPWAHVSGHQRSSISIKTPNEVILWFHLNWINWYANLVSQLNLDSILNIENNHRSINFQLSKTPKLSYIVTKIALSNKTQSDIWPIINKLTQTRKCPLNIIVMTSIRNYKFRSFPNSVHVVKVQNAKHPLNVAVDRIYLQL